MKQNKKRIILAIITIVAITTIMLVTRVFAENTGGTERDRMNEHTFVAMTATAAKLKNSATELDVDMLKTEMESIVGTNVVTVADKSSDIILVTFLETGNEYEVNKLSALGGGYNPEENPEIPVTPGDDELPSTEDTTPYLPTGFSAVADTDLSNGLTIQDGAGNQYVWVQVPKSLYENESYNTETTAGDRKPDSSTDYTDIEYCLHQYTATYRNGTSYTDTWYSESQHGFASSDEYNAHKYNMLKSVYEKGGFYVGKYETGIADTEPDVVDTNHEARTAEGDATQTPVIQANAYPYNYVTNKQAQELASTKFNGGGYTTSLMFGVQWDLVLKHLEVSGAATTAELNSDSTLWGNYNNNTTTDVTNTSAKYAETTAYTWTDGAYGKKSESKSVVLSTGASTDFERGGIYDLAGNIYEWTLEYSSAASAPCTARGGAYGRPGRFPASDRFADSAASGSRGISFRVALY